MWILRQLADDEKARLKKASTHTAMEAWRKGIIGELDDLIAKLRP